MDNNGLREHIDQKLTHIDQKLAHIDKHLAVYNEQLKLHILRTEIAERNIEILKDLGENTKRHIHMVEGAIKLIGLLSIIVAITSGILAIV